MEFAIVGGPLATAIASALASRVSFAAEGDGGNEWQIIGESLDGRLSLDVIAGAVIRGQGTIVVGGRANRGVLASALTLGVTWVIDADTSFTRMLAVAESVVVGDCRLTSDKRRRWVEKLLRQDEEGSRFNALTDRECEVLAALADGWSVTDIAKNRPVAVSTVRSQVAALLGKLSSPSQQAAVALTYRSCWDSRVLDAVWHRQN